MSNKIIDSKEDKTNSKEDQTNSKEDQTNSKDQTSGTESWADFYKRSIFSWQTFVDDRDRDVVRPAIVPKEVAMDSEEEREEEEKTYRMEEVKEHWETTSCWIVIHDVVYDVTGFIATHPGGQEILMEHGGNDATVPFTAVGHSIDAKSILAKYRIGRLTKEDCIENNK